MSSLRSSHFVASSSHSSSTNSGNNPNSSTSKFSNRNLNITTSTKSNSISGSSNFGISSKGNYAVIQGDRAKSGKIASTTVVPPIPVNTPAQKKDIKIPLVSNPSTGTWGLSTTSNSAADSHRGGEASDKNASTSTMASSIAPWAPQQSQNQEVSSTNTTTKSVKNMNWADLDSDDDEPTPPQQPISDVITIERDEVYTTEFAPSSHGAKLNLDADADMNWRSSGRNNDHGHNQYHQHSQPHHTQQRDRYHSYVDSRRQPGGSYRNDELHDSHYVSF